MNTGLVSSEMAPFGGIKQSCMGREGSKIWRADDYVDIKYICLYVALVSETAYVLVSQRM